MKLNRVVSALFIAIFFIGCTAEKSQKAKETFVYCSEASPAIFNPQLATDGPTFNASSRTIYNRLVSFEPGGTLLIPSLAKSWESSKDGLTYTLSLREDVAFHSREDFKPTRKFNADDVLFTFHRMLQKTHPYHKVNGGTYEYFRSMSMGDLIQEIEKINSHTVRFRLNRPEAPFIANLAMDFASILSKEYADYLLQKKTPEKIDLEPVGTGPFKLKRYVKDTNIRYERFEDYYEGPAKIKNLIFAITPDPNVRLQKLKAGECHLIAEPASTDVDAIAADPNLKLLQQPGLNVGYVAMNTEKTPFNNVNIRRAIHHALHRDNYIKAIYMGHASKAKNPVPPAMWSYNEKVKDYDYNIEKAKELLAEAGYPDGFEIELWTLPVSRPYNPNGKKMGELIQADLAKVGIRVRLVTYKWATYLEKASRGEHQMLQLGWTGDNGDPDNFLYVLLSCDAARNGSNYARWCNKEYDQLVVKAKKTSDQKQREKLYQQAQVLFKQQAPWVTVAHAMVFRGLSKDVKGYQMSPFGVENFYPVELQ